MVVGGGIGKPHHNPVHTVLELYGITTLLIYFLRALCSTQEYFTYTMSASLMFEGKQVVLSEIIHRLLAGHLYSLKESQQ